MKRVEEVKEEECDGEEHLEDRLGQSDFPVDGLMIPIPFPTPHFPLL